MKKIPAAYNQKHTRNELIKALDSLRSQLLVDLRRYFNLYYIDTPLVTNPLPSIYNDRSINFDNLKSGSLYQYLNYPDLAMIKMIHEMEDEHDHTQHVDPVEIGPQKWRMPSRTPINEVEEIFEIDMDEDEVDTVYGLLTKLLGSVPVVGQSAVTHGLRFTAVETAGRRRKVSMVDVEPISEDEDQKTEEDE